MSWSTAMNSDDTRIDRLVDDELSEEERRQVLGQLDDEPGGGGVALWRSWKLNVGDKFSGNAERPRWAGAALQSNGENAGRDAALRRETLPIQTPLGRRCGSAA